MKLNSFQKTAITTVAATLFLILVGGLVRAAGAGLGCPDWPRCFGSWIPPLSVADLPPEFDPSQFNVVKTWIEYVNRLVGVSIGILIILTFLHSFRYRKSAPVITWCSGIALVLVVFQGWLGGQVVESELSEWLITMHMLLAMIIVNILLYAAFKAVATQLPLQIAAPSRHTGLWISSGIFILSLFQMLVGTQVREHIDAIGKATPDLAREYWLPSIGYLYEFHRSFSWAIVVLAVALILWLYRSQAGPAFRITVLAILFLVAAQFAAGVGLDKLAIPPVLQTVHLVLGSLLICAEFFLLLLLFESRVAARREKMLPLPAN